MTIQAFIEGFQEAGQVMRPIAEAVLSDQVRVWPVTGEEIYPTSWWRGLPKKPGWADLGG